MKKYTTYKKSIPGIKKYITYKKKYISYKKVHQVKKYTN